MANGLKWTKENAPSHALLETFNQQKTGQLKPTVGLVVDFRPNPALSSGTSSDQQALEKGNCCDGIVTPNKRVHAVSA